MKWSEKRLDELGTISRGRSRHRPRDAAHLYGGPYPFVQTGDIKRADLYLTQFSQTYSAAGLAQSRLWPPNTLCITIAANIAETAVLAIDACFPDSVIGFTADERKCDVRFIKYLFDTIKERYQQVSRGAAQENLSQEKLLSFSVTVPPVEVQRRIANVLSAYDRLIDNNRRRMALLEEAARHLYEQWFVRLRFPGHEHARVRDGVPEGWKKVPLGQALVLQRGFDLPTHERQPGNVPIYGSTGIVGFHNTAVVRGSGIVTGRSGSLGQVHFVPMDYWPLNTALWVREFAQVSPLFALFLLRGLDLSKYNGGASVPTLDRKVVHRLGVIIPDRASIKQFDAIANSLFAQINVLQVQSEKLRAGRGLLLPRLMSGEIAV